MKKKQSSEKIILWNRSMDYLAFFCVIASLWFFYSFEPWNIFKSILLLKKYHLFYSSLFCPPLNFSINFFDALWFFSVVGFDRPPLSVLCSFTALLYTHAMAWWYTPHCKHSDTNIRPSTHSTFFCALGQNKFNTLLP